MNLNNRLLYFYRTVGLRFFLVFLSIFISSANAEDVKYKGKNIPDQSGRVITVLGDISPETMGQTLMHEHIFMEYFASLETDWWDKQEKTRGSKRPETQEEIEIWNDTVTIRNLSSLKFKLNHDFYTLNSKIDAIDEVSLYKKLGGNTIVDVTPVDLGRKPRELQEISKNTGINIVMATGFYEGAYHPADMGQRTLDDLTLYMVREIIHGVGDTGIQAGIIGEISTTYMKFNPESNDVRVLRAAARTSQLTGVAISLHNDIVKSKNNVHVALDVLEEEGLDLSRVIVGHIPGLIPPKGQEPSSVDYLESLLSRGVYLQFDTLGAPYKKKGYYIEDFQVELLIELIKRGYSGQLLMSHDIFTKAHLTKFGGFGLTFIHGHLIPYLLKNGIHQYQIDKITVDNPRHVLTLDKPRKL